MVCTDDRKEPPDVFRDFVSDRGLFHWIKVMGHFWLSHMAVHCYHGQRNQFDHHGCLWGICLGNYHMPSYPRDLVLWANVIVLHDGKDNSSPSWKFRPRFVSYFRDCGLFQRQSHSWFRRYNDIQLQFITVGPDTWNMIWSGHRAKVRERCVVFGWWDESNCHHPDKNGMVPPYSVVHTFFAFQLQNIKAGFWVSSELRLLKVPTPMRGMDFVVSRSIGSSLLRHMSSAAQPLLGSIEDWHLLTEVHANWEHASWPNSCVGVSLQIWELKTHDARSKNSQMLCCFWYNTLEHVYVSVRFFLVNQTCGAKKANVTS